MKVQKKEEFVSEISEKGVFQYLGWGGGLGKPMAMCFSPVN